MVGRTKDGRYIIKDAERIGATIAAIERNSATRGTARGTREPGKRKRSKAPQICRLHNVEFYSRMAYTLRADLDTLRVALDDWRRNETPGVVHWFKEAAVEGLKARAKFHIALGPRRSSIQIWINPIFINSFKLFEILNAVHDSAQQTLRWLSKNYKLEFGLLEARKEKHFAIKIPIKEGWRLGELGYGLRNGKVWINEDWWIDESYGHELETANEVAFKELVELPGEVKGMRSTLDKILDGINSLRPKPPPPPPPVDNPVEVA